MKPAQTSLQLLSNPAATYAELTPMMRRLRAARDMGAARARGTDVAGGGQHQASGRLLAFRPRTT